MANPFEIIDQQPCVGLFGSCGDTTFRQDLFIPKYDRLGIPYFNPQVPDWDPKLAEVEADHLAYDVVQCWPVTGDTLGGGSLGEVGFSIAQSLKSQSPLPKFIIPMVETSLSAALDDEDEEARERSLRARKLAAAHLANVSSHNVFVVTSLEQMLDTSIRLYEAAAALVGLAKTLNPEYVRFARDYENRRGDQLERNVLDLLQE